MVNKVSLDSFFKEFLVSRCGTFRLLFFFIFLVFLSFNWGACNSNSDKKVRHEDMANEEEMGTIEADKFLKLNGQSTAFFLDYFNRSYNSFLNLDSTDDFFLRSFLWTADSNKVISFLQDSFLIQQVWVEDSFLNVQIENWDEYLSNYSKYFVFNNDSSFFLDWISYSFILERDKSGKLTVSEGEPDQQVFLVDADLRRRFRVYFSGPGTVISSGLFLGESNFMVVGFVAEGSPVEQSEQLFRVDSSAGNVYYSENEKNSLTKKNEDLKTESGENMVQKLVPFVIKVDVNERLFELFQYVGNRDWTDWVQRERKVFLSK